jgi:hypothetical protein
MLRHTQKENGIIKDKKIIYGYLQRHVPVLPSLKTESSNHGKRSNSLTPKVTFFREKKGGLG